MNKYIRQKQTEPEYGPSRKAMFVAVLNPMTKPMRDAFIGDLEDEWEEIRSRFGRYRANQWLWLQVIGSYTPLVSQSIKSYFNLSKRDSKHNPTADSGHRPSGLALFIAGFLPMSKTQRVEVLGDLEETWLDLCTRFGPEHANSFLWSHVLSSYIPFLKSWIANLIKLGAGKFLGEAIIHAIKKIIS